MKTTERYLYIGSILSIVLMLASAVSALFLLLRPYNVLTVNNEPMPIVGEGPFVAGDVIPYEADLCKATDALATINYEFIGPSVVTSHYSVPSYATPAGCVHFVSKAAIAPAYLDPGEYFINVHVSYKVNPLRTVSYVIKTEQFTIEEVRGD